MQVGDVGIAIRGIVRRDSSPVDLSGLGASYTFNVRRPDQTTFTRAGSHVTDGSDGAVEMITEAGDLTISGKYGVWVTIAEGGGATYNTSTVRIEVEAN